MESREKMFFRGGFWFSLSVGSSWALSAVPVSKLLVLVTFRSISISCFCLCFLLLVSSSVVGSRLLSGLAGARPPLAEVSRDALFPPFPSQRKLCSRGFVNSYSLYLTVRSAQ